MSRDAGFLHHRLRLFFSVDLVGSTSLKQGREKESLDEHAASSSWFSAVGIFYSAIPGKFRQAWSSIQERLPDATLAGDEPVFWKVLGDEILYYKEITDYRQVLIALDAWRTAVNAVRALIRKDFPSLDLKSAAWVANFPGPNFELAFRPDGPDPGTGSMLTERVNLESLHDFYEAKPRDQAAGNLVLDFIGPSMDTGFRLAGLATPRKLVVSVGLAWMLARTVTDRALSRCTGEWFLYFDGGVPLKGVLGRSLYPVFWVDLAHDNPRLRLEDELLHRAAADPRKVAAYCEGAVERHEDYLFKPYIDPDRYPKNRKFREVPPEHAARLKRLTRLWKGR